MPIPTPDFPFAYRLPTDVAALIGATAVRPAGAAQAVHVPGRRGMGRYLRADGAGRIQQVLVVRNPDRLAGLSVVVSGADLGSRG